MGDMRKFIGFLTGGLKDGEILDILVDDYETFLKV